MPKEREVRYVLKRLAKEGWVPREGTSKGKGSHRVLEKDGKSISIPTSRREIRIGTYRQIAKDANWL